MRFGDAGVEGGDGFGKTGLRKNLSPESRYGGFYMLASVVRRW